MANERNWGGKRAGAGRKAKVSNRVPHRVRPFVLERPIRLSLSLRGVIPKNALLRALKFVIQRWTDEVDDKVLSTYLERVSTRGHQISFELFAATGDVAAIAHRFAVRLAKRINRLLKRQGRVFRERYRVLSPPWIAPPPETWKTRVAGAVREGAETLGYTLLYGALSLTGVVMTRRHRF